MKELLRLVVDIYANFVVDKNREINQDHCWGNL